MAQKLIQTQIQKQEQVQRLSQQQLLQVKLLEQPLNELEQSINAELDDNPALERKQDEETDDGDNDTELAQEETFDEKNEREEREDELNKALEDLERDDKMPDVSNYGNNNHTADYEEIVYGETESFYDKLMEQVGVLQLTDKQYSIIEYLIGSLDDNGYLRKNLDTISDELAIYHNLDVSVEETEQSLKLLQSLDPAGIGARSLQECMRLQIERKTDSQLKNLMLAVVDDYFDEFTKKHWDKIRSGLKISDYQSDALQKEILKLNPKPGASLGETMGRSIQQITPDFFVDTDDDGSVSFSLNRGNVPELAISPTFADMVETYKSNKKNMNRQEKEALLYAKQKVEKAQGFIDAVKQRRHTLYVTMKAIIEWQHQFFAEGDEADLRPMILKDVADKTGLDISTISRVSNVKYAQTKWGTFPLRYFFSDSYVTDKGEELSTRKIKIVLENIIDKEDKKNPLSDEALAEKMKEKGFPVARRTIAKYRHQLDIPVARLRKER